MLRNAWVVCVGVWAVTGVAIAQAPTGGGEPTAAAAPPAAEPDPQSQLATLRDPLGRACPPLASQRVEALHYFACGEAGLWVARVDAGGVLSLVTQRDLGGDVVGLFVQDGELWARVQSAHAVPVAHAGSAPAAPAPSAPAQPAAPAAPVAAPVPAPTGLAVAPSAASTTPTGHVVARTRDGVLIDAGLAAGLQRGDRVTFLQQQREVLADGEVDEQMQSIAVGKIASITEGRARVSLGTNEMVPIGTLAERTDAPVSANLRFPPRATGYYELAAMVRPFLVLGELGAGAVSDVAVGYRGEDIHLQARMEPVSIAGASRTIGSAIGILSAAYDADFFALGLGVGGQTVNYREGSHPPGGGVTVSQTGRVGALDGLHLKVSLNVVLFHDRFDFSGARAQVQLPFTPTTQVQLRGGGGIAGTNFGEVAVRLRMAGRGGPGSFFITMSIGGVMVSYERAHTRSVSTGPTASDTRTETVYQSYDFGGPMFGIGGEWRL